MKNVFLLLTSHTGYLSQKVILFTLMLNSKFRHLHCFYTKKFNLATSKSYKQDITQYHLVSPHPISTLKLFRCTVDVQSKYSHTWINNLHSSILVSYWSTKTSAVYKTCLSPPYFTLIRI